MLAKSLQGWIHGVSVRGAPHLGAEYKAPQPKPNTMPNFEYAGRSAQGVLTKGRVEATSLDAVAAQLLERGIIPVNIHPVTETEKAERNIKIMFGSERVTTVDLIMFCRQMYTIAKSGIPLVRGIRILAAGLKHPELPAP